MSLYKYYVSIILRVVSNCGGKRGKSTKAMYFTETAFYNSNVLCQRVLTKILGCFLTKTRTKT